MVGIFTKVNGSLLFWFFLLYSLCLFGIALCVQAIVSTSRAANGFALVFYFLTQQLNGPFNNDNPIPPGTLYMMSVFPTIVMLRMVKLLFKWQYRTDGVDMSNADVEFNTYSISGGLGMLFGMSIFYTLLGLYLD